MATGLLIVCVGRGTKAVDAFMAMTKEYTGVLRLGEGTPSYDAESEVEERLPWEHITGVGGVGKVPVKEKGAFLGPMLITQLVHVRLSVSTAADALAMPRQLDEPIVLPGGDPITGVTPAAPYSCSASGFDPCPCHRRAAGGGAGRLPGRHPAGAAHVLGHPGGRQAAVRGRAGGRGGRPPAPHRHRWEYRADGEFSKGQPWPRGLPCASFLDALQPGREAVLPALLLCCRRCC
jgi:hypothetical protein